MASMSNQLSPLNDALVQKCLIGVPKHRRAARGVPCVHVASVPASTSQARRGAVGATSAMRESNIGGGMRSPCGTDIGRVLHPYGRGIHQKSDLGRQTISPCRARQKLVRTRRGGLAPTRGDGIEERPQEDEEEEKGGDAEGSDESYETNETNGINGTTEAIETIEAIEANKRVAKGASASVGDEVPEEGIAVDSTLENAEAKNQISGLRPQRTEEEAERMRIEVSRKIRRYGKDGKLAAAIDAFTEMQIEGIAPDLVAATALIDCCVRCGEISRAERAFSTLFVTPPSATQPRAPSGARAESQSAVRAPSALQPDDIVVGVMLRAYGRRNPPQWAKIQQLLSRMEAEFGLQPSAAIFNELVDICSRDNEVERGIQLLERMAQTGVEPDEFTFAAVKRRRALRSHFKKLFMA